jgi:hypothetical protein
MAEVTKMGIIEKDLKVAALSFKADDFDLMNIIGNRTMSDAVFFKKVNLAVAGFFVKQVALSFANLKPRLSDSELLEAKLSGDKYTAFLSECNEETDQVQAWANYHQFNLDMRKYPTTGINKQIAEVYGEDYEATSNVRKWLIDFLDANKMRLCDNRNNFIKGIMNELQRVGIAFGYEVKDTIIFSCLLALDRFYDYFRLQYETQIAANNEEAVKTQLFPFLERIRTLSSETSINYEEVNSLLYDMIKKWREYFIYYMELSPRIPPKQVELSKETKTKLSECLRLLWKSQLN